MSRIFELPSSNNVLVEEGVVDEKTLCSLVKEAYKEKGLYAECLIKVGNDYGGFNFITYKEMWDLYRNFSGKEDYHPYDKEHPFSLGKAFVLKRYFEKEMEFLGEILDVVVGEIKLHHLLPYVKKKEGKKTGASKRNKINGKQAKFEVSGRPFINEVFRESREQVKKKKKALKKENSEVYYSGHRLAPRNPRGFYES
jgi:hypothetical protein